MIEILILIHFNFELKTLIKSNFNDYVSIKILFQKERHCLICRFFFKTLLSTKCHYKIYDKKLLAIICCFEK